MPNQKAHHFLVVTGLSGAGVATALKSLEDMGYEVFDNFPPLMIDDLLRKSSLRPVAVGMDVRTRDFGVAMVRDILTQHDGRLLFLTATDEMLQKRFTETRRRHPLARGEPVAAGLGREREMMEYVMGLADVIIDTTDLSVHDLRRALEGHYALDDRRRLTLTLMSFGFRYGVPREADIVMDLRFLKNPHWVPELKPLTGRDAPVGEYIEQDPHYAPFVARLQGLLEPLLPLYAHEGKSYLTIALGCTGGRHRSVYTVEKFRAWLEAQGIPAYIKHRDVAR